MYVFFVFCQISYFIIYFLMFINLYNNQINIIFSEAPKDLIRKLLVVDPKKRISIKEALEHSFFHTVVCILV